MDILGGLAYVVASLVGIFLFLVWPVWSFLLLYRALRSLGQIAGALFQIRDALRKESDQVQEAQRHVANSMFGR